MIKEFYIYKRDDKITNLQVWANNLGALPDGSYHVRIERKNKRSGEQNRYYWGLVIPLIQKGLEDLGHEITKEETHEFLKAKFNAFEIVNEDTGECVSIPRSTRRLGKSEFSEYIGKIQQFAAEFLNTVIPDAGTQTKIFDIR